ncbi:efflux RND transporter periplasmic adaptor subunit [Anaerosporobacter sp.]|uniref:efflux RND transporter periplasmic adaptor subunit n=1 Tax=Anaerosporobacter sp. TaxID=1872529 RepID=UPI00286F72F3|nr:efflux RND transporter periplasmic adaptor subunit [Anaerosporobacter sp.]
MKKKEPNKEGTRVKVKSKGKFGKKKVIIIFACVGVLAIGTVAINLNSKSEAATETVYKETTATKGNLTVGITESGNTVLGTQTVDYDITATSSSTSSSSSSSSQSNMMGGASTGSSSSSSSSTSTTMPSLEVEEIYVSASDSVTEGDAILKVTDESYNSVKTYLEQAVTSAELALQQAEINRTLTKTTADSEYKSNSSQSELAQETYNNTIKKLANSVTSAQRELTNTKESIASYKKAISNDTYYTDYKIDTLKKAVKTKQKTVDTLTAKVEKLESSSAASTSVETKVEQSDEISGNTSGTSELETYKTQLQQAEQELAAAEQSYDQAYEKYESALAQAKSELEKLQNQLNSVQLSYDEAVTNQKKGKLDAQATLDAALVTANNASTLHDIDLDGIDDEVTTATETLETATEQLENFNALVVDGKIVANCSGLVTAVGYAVGDSISSSTSIVTIADATEVTITVSVDQEDIASIAVNDEVNVDLTAYAGITYTAVVSSISTTASSDNSSTVTYPVVVTLTGDVSAIYSGMSADVTFVTKEMQDVLYVSNKTIINDGTKSYVKVKDSDGTIRKEEVTTGFSDGNNVEILSGVTEGETVLIESQVKSN